MNGNQEYIKNETMNNFKKVIEGATEEQLQFVEDITEGLILDKDTNKVNAVPAPCGFGKSVLIRSYLKSVIELANTFEIFGATRQKYEGDGFVIVTDLLERFEEYNEDEVLKEYCYMMYYNDDFNESFQKQLIEQDNYPILLMSTQKYFKLDETEKDFIFKWKHGLRKTIIFDEKPIFYNITEIDKEFINTIDNEIDPISETEDKNFLDNELKFLRDYLEEEKGKLSGKSEEEDVICYWKGTRKNISTDDTQFLKLTNDYLSTDSKIKVNTLKEILENGAIFINKKNKQVTDNRRMFFTIEDNKNNFYLGEDRAKFWIFDATADVDAEYQKDYINMIDVEYTKDFIVNVENVNIGTSRNAINKKGTKDVLYNYIEDNFDKETLVITYQKDIKDFLEFNTGYLGGIKGSNKYRDCVDMAQIGLNRYSDIDYLQKYLYLNPKTYEYIRNNVTESETKLNELLKMEYGNFANEDMNNIMYSMLLVDTEQNIFRTKLRNYANRDNIKIELIYNSKTYEKLNEMLAKRLGIDEIKVTLPLEFLEYNILSRDNEKESHAQKVVRYFNENEGYGEIKTKDLLKNVGISNKQFDRAKRSNDFSNFMNSKKTNKRGYYEV